MTQLPRRMRWLSLVTLWTIAVALIGAAARAQDAPAGGGSPAGERTRRIVFGGDRDFPPLEMLDKQGAPQGFQVELIREVARVNDWDVSVVLGPWSEIIEKFKSGEIDVIGMADLPERRDYALFAAPHSVYASEIFHRKGSLEAFSLEELSGHEVIVQRGALADEWLEENKVAAERVYVETEADALRLLASGQHDFAIVTQFGGRSAMARLELTNLTTSGPLVLQSDYAFAVRSGREDLRAAIDQGQAILKRTGVYNRIYEKWLGDMSRPSVPLEVVRRLALWVGLPLAALALGTIGWNWALRQQVSLRTAALREELSRRELAQRALAESEERFKTLTEHAPEAILVIEPVSMRIVEANENAAWLFKKDHEALLQSDPLATLASVRPDESFDPRDAERLVTRAMNAESVHAERVVRDGLGATIPCELRLVRLMSQGRWLVRVSITDISERYDAERRQETMTAELDHRVKNSLAMVSGLAAQMLQEKPEPAAFAQALSDRIRAISDAHEALAKSHWDGVRVADAMALAFRPYAGWPCDRVSVTGDNLLLAPEHATAVCMVLHELALNAVKHGALRNDAGSLSVHARNDEDSACHILWTEATGHDEEPRVEKGVGVSLVKGLVEYQLRGRASVATSRGGLVWTITIPASALAKPA